MVKIALQIRASLEHLTGLEPDDPDEFRWWFKFKCSSCAEVPDHWQYISRSEDNPVKGGRGSANCVIKCKLCGRENSCDVLEDSLKTYDFTDSNRFKSIVAFDCRGMEPVEFSPREGWTCRGFAEDETTGDGDETGTVFEDIDLADREWADYDEKSGKSVCISDLQFQFVKIK